jgi:ribonuclease BN (tRNA processing enzyme)
VFLTDNELDFIHPGGLSFDAYKEFSAGADLLIHDGEYTEEEYRSVRKWGGSIYKTALELAVEAGVKQLGIFHLNQDRTDKEVDHMINICEEIITTKGSSLKCSAVGCDTTFDL